MFNELKILVKRVRCVRFYKYCDSRNKKMQRNETIKAPGDPLYRLYNCMPT